MNSTNIASYLYGAIIGGVLTGGVVGGFFTQWRGDIASTLSVVGSILGFLGLVFHFVALSDI